MLIDNENKNYKAKEWIAKYMETGKLDLELVEDLNEEEDN